MPRQERNTPTKAAQITKKHWEVIVEQSKTALAFLSIPSLQEASRGNNITNMPFKSNLTVKSDTQDSNVGTVVQRTTGKRDIRMWRHFHSGPADSHRLLD